MKKLERSQVLRIFQWPRVTHWPKVDKRVTRQKALPQVGGQGRKQAGWKSCWWSLAQPMTLCLGTNQTLSVQGTFKTWEEPVRTSPSWFLKVSPIHLHCKVLPCDCHSFLFSLLYLLHTILLVLVIFSSLWALGDHQMQFSCFAQEGHEL